MGNISSADKNSSQVNPNKLKSNSINLNTRLLSSNHQKNSSTSSIFSSTAKSIISLDRPILNSKMISAKSMKSILHPILNYSTDHKDVESALEILELCDFDINAIWVVSKPIDRIAKGKFRHWAIKILADPILVTLDFFEKNGTGSYGVDVKSVSWEELGEFLFYDYYKKVNAKWKYQKKKWTIESYIMPKFRDERKKFNNLDINDNNLYSMPSEIIDCMLQMTEELHDDKNLELFSKIKCDKNVYAISEFIQQWNSKYESYNALTSNCQRYIQDLYEWLASDSQESPTFDDLVIFKEHVQKCKLLSKKLQSWHDWVYELEKSQRQEKNKKNNENKKNIIMEDVKEPEEENGKHTDEISKTFKNTEEKFIINEIQKKITKRKLMELNNTNKTNKE